MFVSDKSLGEIQKLYFFNDKELPAMGSKSERLVLQFLELLSNPTAVTPHTNTFSMDKKNQFVTDNAVCANVTPTNNTSIALNSIKQELQESYPLLKRLKVKRFYNTGRVKATACIGKRKIRITGSLFNVIEKFTAEYQDRLPTAFTNLNTI